MVKQQKPVGAIVRSVPVGVGRWCSWLPPGLCGDDRGAFTLPSRITLRVAAPIKLVTTSRHGPRECFLALRCSKGRNPPARGKETGTVVGPVHLIFWESVCWKLNSSGFYQSSSFRDRGYTSSAGINRHVVGDERALQERSTANPSWPRVLRVTS